MVDIGFDFRGVMLAVVAIQKQAMMAYPGGAIDAEAFPFFFRQCQTYPYFVNRLATINVSSDSEEIDAEGFDVTMRLYAGKVTSGQDGEREIELQSWIGWIIKYFNERETLQSKEYKDGVDNIDKARITLCPGVMPLPSISSETQEFGTEFTLRVEARTCIGLDYDGDGY